MISFSFHKLCDPLRFSKTPKTWAVLELIHSQFRANLLKVTFLRKNVHHGNRNSQESMMENLRKTSHGHFVFVCRVSNITEHKIRYWQYINAKFIFISRNTTAMITICVGQISSLLCLSLSHSVYVVLSLITASAILLSIK